MDVVQNSAPRLAPRRAGLRVGIALAAACAALALTGCTAPGTDYAVLDGDAQARDEVPESLPAYAWETADPATARFVGEHDRASLWLMRASDEDAVCLLAYGDASSWIIGCGGSQFGVGGGPGSFTVVPDGAPHPDGMTQLSDNVFTSAAE